MNHPTENLTRGYRQVVQYVVSSFPLKCAEYGDITDLQVSFTIQS
jgi:hypothetical protein